MSNMVEILTDLIAALDAGDVSAVADPADLNPPAVLLAVDSIHPTLLNGSGTIDVRLNLCVPNVGWQDALAALDDLFEKVADVLDLDDPVIPETLIVAGAQLPSLRATVPIFYERTGA